MKIAGHHVDEAMFTYIAQNIDADTCKLLLKAEPELTFDKSFAVMQIECRRKTRDKIPELLANCRFLFPKAISAEQCTHEVVAQFHASLFNEDDDVLDMTMGLGVDDYYIAQRVKTLTAIELDPEIAAVGEYNFSFLAPNVNVEQGDSVEFLKQLGEKHYDAIFIDPARRDSSGKRVYGLADCSPDVLSLLPLIKEHCTRLFIKASPMIDVTQSMRDLGENLTQVWAVSVKNECKELFFELDFANSAVGVMLHAFNYTGIDWQEFSIENGLGSGSNSIDAILPGQYLYEPNSSVMKLGCYNAVEDAFCAKQVAKNSHLMVSDKYIDDFPGRQFKVTEIIPFKGKDVKLLGKRYGQMNVATRNFRLSAEQLRKRLGVKDGGDIYLFATTLGNGEQVLILCEKA